MKNSLLMDLLEGKKKKNGRNSRVDKVRKGRHLMCLA